MQKEIKNHPSENSDPPRRAYPPRSFCPCGLHPENLTEEGLRMMEQNLLDKGYEKLHSGGFILRRGNL